MINSPLSDGGTGSASPAEAAPSTPCLYFLVSAAKEGPLAGLCKVGTTECFPRRYDKHVRKWGAFDLTRSALWRVTSRVALQGLEGALRRVFGYPEAEAAAKAAGKKILTSADYHALGSGRRHPGRREDGHTEFFAAERLPAILAFCETWLRSCGERGAGATLKRGIDPADCAWNLAAETGAAPLTPEERARQRKEQRAEWRLYCEEERAIVEARIVADLHQVLAFAEAHEPYLLYVYLKPWRQMRADVPDCNGGCGRLAELYFGGFGEAVAADPAAGPAALRAFQESFALRLGVPAGTELSDRACGYASERVATLEAASGHHKDGIHDATRLYVGGEDTQLVRVRPWYYRCIQPFFERFDALSRRVEARRVYEQLSFNL